MYIVALSVQGLNSCATNNAFEGKVEIVYRNL